MSNRLVELRAGKCTLTGTRVTPDLRKGLLYLTRGEDDLTRLCWMDRTTHQVEDELIIVADADLIRCDQSKDVVFLLKFKSSDQRLFFWNQEPNVEHAMAMAEKMNNILNMMQE